jgi:hypothetical protein
MLRFLRRLRQQDKSEWPFDQPPNCAVITTTHVMKDGADITQVSHDLDDHGWQFHYSGEKKDSDAMVVLLKTIVDHDPTLLEVADIPPGWVAVRSQRGAAWQKRRNG